MIIRKLFALLVDFVLYIFDNFIFLFPRIIFRKREVKRYNEKNSKLILNGLSYIKDLTFFKKLDQKGRSLLVRNAIIIISGVKMVDERNQPLDELRSFKIGLVLSMGSFALEKNNFFKKLQFVKVYPSQFYSEQVGQKVRGLASRGGALGISWEDFEYGFTTNLDRYNVALHEMAHLLEICGYINLQSNDYWKQQATLLINAVNSESAEMGLFRPYSFTNLMEFWACCVEQFYEMPIEFAKRHTELYLGTKKKLGF